MTLTPPLTHEIHQAPCYPSRRAQATQSLSKSPFLIQTAPYGPMFWGLNHVKSFLISLNHPCWSPWKSPLQSFFTDLFICSVHWLRDLLWLKSPCFFGSTLWFYTLVLHQSLRKSLLLTPWPPLGRPPFGLSRAGHAFHAQLQDVALLHWVHFTAELSRTQQNSLNWMFRDVSCNGWKPSGGKGLLDLTVRIACIIIIFKIV